jgi:hypothetical protein
MAPPVASGSNPAEATHYSLVYDVSSLSGWSSSCTIPAPQSSSTRSRPLSTFGEDSPLASASTAAAGGIQVSVDGKRTCTSPTG